MTNLRRMETQQHLMLMVILVISMFNVNIIHAQTFKLTPLCSENDLKVPIDISECNANGTITETICTNRIRSCYCQHDVELKWTTVGPVGCTNDGGSLSFVSLNNRGSRLLKL